MDRLTTEYDMDVISIVVASCSPACFRSAIKHKLPTIALWRGSRQRRGTGSIASSLLDPLRVYDWRWTDQDMLVCVRPIMELVAPPLLTKDGKRRSDMASQFEAPDVGDTAPDFELQTVSGDGVHLADLRGQPVVLIFYRGSW